MAFSREMILKARQADLVEYLRSRGYELKKEGRNWRLPGYGGLVVRGNSYYQFSAQVGGNSLDFCMKIFCLPFWQAVLELNGASLVASFEPGKKVKRELEMPTRFRNEHRVIAYLTKTRMLPAGLVVNLIKAGLLYQDKIGNCVFVCRDDAGRALAAILEGTITKVRWKGLAPGSDTSFGWFWPGPAGRYIDTVIVFESPIDAMSLAVLRPEIRFSHLLALGGLHREALEGFLNRKNILRVGLAFDNDEWGQKAAQEWQEWLLDEGYTVLNLTPDKPAKDWNDMLKLPAAWPASP